MSDNWRIYAAPKYIYLFSFKWSTISTKDFFSVLREVYIKYNNSFEQVVHCAQSTVGNIKQVS